MQKGLGKGREEKMSSPDKAWVWLHYKGIVELAETLPDCSELVGSIPFAGKESAATGAYATLLFCVISSIFFQYFAFLLALVIGCLLLRSAFTIEFNRALAAMPYSTLISTALAACDRFFKNLLVIR